jgi:hypothetical protein
MRPEWIADWSKIRDDWRYIVAPLNSDLSIVQPNFLLGWQVKRLIEKCYVAMPCPSIPEHVLDYIRSKS